MPDTRRTDRSRLGAIAALLGDEVRYRSEEVALMLRRAYRRSRITAETPISPDVQGDIEKAILKTLREDHVIDNMASLIGRSGYRQHRLSGLSGEDITKIAMGLIISGKIVRNSDGTFSINPNNSETR